MRSIKHQQGVTAIGWLIILALIAFFVSLALKLTPVFIENYNIKTSMQSMERTSGLYNKSKRSIQILMQTKLEINAVKSVDINDVQVVKRAGVVYIDIEYSVKVPFMGPISIVADFHESAEAVN